MFWVRLKHSLDMIKFEHSVFALPFALTGAALALRVSRPGVWDAVRTVGLIVICMVAARSAAMAFNRVVDVAIDAKNPRTRMRHLPTGVLSTRFAWMFVAVASLIFLAGAWGLNTLCFRLAPVALGIVFFYSYTKRFTSLSHLVLGFCLGIAPAAAWIAVRGRLELAPVLLAAAVTFWTAGFDIIYSCQDYDFDRESGLHSVPARMGIANALLLARLLHVLMIAALVWLVALLGLGGLAVAGVATVAALLVYEHSLVSAKDLSKVNAAFFTMNGWASVLFFVFWTADILL